MSELPTESNNQEKYECSVAKRVHALAREVTLQKGSPAIDDPDYPPEKMEWTAHWEDDGGMMQYTLKMANVFDDSSFGLTIFDIREAEDIFCASYYYSDPDKTPMTNFHMSGYLHEGLESIDDYYYAAYNFLKTADDVDVVPESSEKDVEREKFWGIALSYAMQSAFDDPYMNEFAKRLGVYTNVGAVENVTTLANLQPYLAEFGIPFNAKQVGKAAEKELKRRRDWANHL